jgi:hypothetical protein
MIKPNELRLGNIARVANITGIVKTLYSDGEVEMSFSPEYEYIYEDLHPIPLTHELLELYGVKESGFAFSAGLFELPTVGHQLHYDAGIYTYSYYDKQLRDVEFLHQVQNLYFALTGEELTIKL